MGEEDQNYFLTLVDRVEYRDEQTTVHIEIVKA